MRNPLAAAMSACSFVASAVNEAEPLKDLETQRSVREDIEVVSASLQYINDFLRSMLTIHQADCNKIKMEMAPTDLLHDVFEPISSILYKRATIIEVLVECPENLIVMTDVIRLKQVVLNLVRNASKFVERGFLRMRAEVVDGQVQIYVEDSGPGIPLEKQKSLFDKYQASLDLLGQGTGIGLSLSKKLMDAMDGDIGLDTAYHSGIEGCPGACFVIRLNREPVNMSSAFSTEIETDPLSDTPAPFALGPPVSSGPTKGCHLQEGDEENQLVVETYSSNAQANNNPPLWAVTPEQNACPSKTPSEASADLPVELSVLFVDDDAVLRKLFVRAVKRAMPSWTINEASNGETALKMCESQLPWQYDLIFLDQ